MRFSIQQKLFILLAGLSTAVLLGVLYSISQKLEAEILKKVASDSRQTQRNFAKEQTLRYDRLIESATLIGENSTFKGNVQVNDPGTVNHIVEEFSEFARRMGAQLLGAAQRSPAWPCRLNSSTP